MITMLRVKIVFTFLLGFSIGAVIAILLFLSKNFNVNGNEFIYRFPSKNVNNNLFSVKTEFLTQGNDYNKHFWNKKTNFKPNYNSNILCVIFSSDLSKSFAASKTWARHCDNYHFFAMDDGVTDIAELKYLPVTTLKPKHSWDFLCNTILYIYRLYRRKLQWVIFVHDNVFVIPENLRYYVIYKDFTKPYYLGDLSFFWSIHYNTAEAGFVLSKGAIKLLVKKFNSTKQCEISGKHWRAEDMYLGKYLNSLH